MTSVSISQNDCLIVLLRAVVIPILAIENLLLHKKPCRTLLTAMF